MLSFKPCNPFRETSRIYKLLILYGLVTHLRSLFQKHLDLPTGTLYTQCKTPSLQFQYPQTDFRWESCYCFTRPVKYFAPFSDVLSNTEVYSQDNAPNTIQKSCYFPSLFSAQHVPKRHFFLKPTLLP